jgi:predicted nucleotidyltransferase
MSAKTRRKVKSSLSPLIPLIKKQIVEKLMPLNPEKIILFGSYAYGEPNSDSDLDLYVVTNDDFMPKSWKESSALYLSVSKRLRDLRKKIPIDLIVHTKQMHKKLVQLDSNFYRNSIQKGVELS